MAEKLPEPDTKSGKTQSVLGVEIGDIAGLSVDEVSKSKPALKMLMHYYHQLVEENSALKNDINTLQTYVAGYRKVRQHANVGAVLLALGGMLVAFGVNLLTQETVPTRIGLTVFAPGVLVEIAGLWFSLNREEK
jgi:hypothetical protein